MPPCLTLTLIISFGFTASAGGRSKVPEKNLQLPLSVCLTSRVSVTSTVSLVMLSVYEYPKVTELAKAVSK